MITAVILFKSVFYMIYFTSAIGPVRCIDFDNIKSRLETNIVLAEPHERAGFDFPALFDGHKFTGVGKAAVFSELYFDKDKKIGISRDYVYLSKARSIIQFNDFISSTAQVVRRDLLAPISETLCIQERSSPLRNQLFQKRPAVNLGYPVFAKRSVMNLCPVPAMLFKSVIRVHFRERIHIAVSRDLRKNGRR